MPIDDDGKKQEDEHQENPDRDARREPFTKLRVAVYLPGLRIHC
jgi:hypothetical protein